MLKRYEYWASDNGKPVKRFTDWFTWDGDTDNNIQLKGYKNNNLLQEFKEA